MLKWLKSWASLTLTRPNDRDLKQATASAGPFSTEIISKQCAKVLLSVEPDAALHWQDAQAEAADQEADDMAEVLGDEPEDVAMAQVVLHQVWQYPQAHCTKYCTVCRMLAASVVVTPAVMT